MVRSDTWRDVSDGYGFPVTAFVVCFGLVVGAWLAYKLIGALHADDFDPANGFLVVTSRASYEMAMKAASVGIALMAAISAPTALAISLADRANLTLIGFARDDGHAVYTHAQRLLHPPTAG